MFWEGLQLMLIDYILLWSAAIMAVLGTGIRAGLGIKYSRLIDEVDKMTTTKNRDLKRCKIKYEKCYAMNQGVANVGAFVDRFLSKLSMGPFTCLALYQMGAQLILLAIILMALLICHRILEGDSLLRLLPYYAASFAGVYVFLTITIVVNVQEKRNVLKISLVDYLENHLTARLESVPSNLAKIQGETKMSAHTPYVHAPQGQVAADKVSQATKPMPKAKVANSNSAKEATAKAHPATVVNPLPTTAADSHPATATEPHKATPPDYQELTKLLEDFFAV